MSRLFVFVNEDDNRPKGSILDQFGTFKSKTENVVKELDDLITYVKKINDTSTLSTLVKIRGELVTFAQSQNAKLGEQ